ncbi:adenylate kinase family protein [Candidatus Woesearchaeota archaeon]|nr:adenylate kinase family protein [Candidatus Woesearchaeota archaeon]
MNKIIIVTGTPGTGKTVLAKKLANLLNFTYIDINLIIKSKKLNLNYDKKRSTYVININKLNRILIDLIKNSNRSLIIDSHLSHCLPNKLVNLCIVTKCNLKVLVKRLKKRKYNFNKIRENMDSEIFDICLNEAVEDKHNVMIIDTAKRIDYKKIIRKIH